MFFLFFFLLGIIIGLVVSFSSDNYLSILTTKDKVFFDYVNGKANFGKEASKLLLSFLIFQTITFILNLNFYLGLFSYVLVAMMVM